MNNKRVTMQDIADACGLSRNTVSKVFNRRGAVPESTQKLILAKAQELGYGAPLPDTAPVPAPATRSIALLTSHMPSDYHFATVLFPTFTDQICRAGYNMKMFEISPEEIRQRRLPSHLNLEETAGMIGIELFDADYLNMMASLGLPTLFIDGPAHISSRLMPCDFVLMENVASVMTVMGQLFAKGARRIGFIGDIEHCASFNERWLGYSTYLVQAGLPFDRALCILEPDSSPYSSPDWLASRLAAIPALPDAFLCANDYLAVWTMAALKKLGVSVPGQVMIAGFDGSSQTTIVDPPLTTVKIPGTDIGRVAAAVLLRRLSSPELPFTRTYVKTTPILRESTRHKPDGGSI